MYQSWQNIKENVTPILNLAFVNMYLIKELLQELQKIQNTFDRVSNLVRLITAYPIVLPVLKTCVRCLSLHWNGNF